MIVLYDWKLTDIHSPRLKLQDLKFVHADALQSVHLITWVSILYLTGVLFAGLTAHGQGFTPGSAEARAWADVLNLFAVQIIFVGVGIFGGWIVPYLHRLEQIRIELRRLDGSLQKEKEISESKARSEPNASS